VPSASCVTEPQNDPLGGGLVASRSRPGGNATRLSIESADTFCKRLELLCDVVPQFRRLAVLFDAGYPAATKEANEVRAVARAFGLDVAPHGICRLDDVVQQQPALTSANSSVLVCRRDALS
jgi:ABC-type uncharacterized transport system substrate-binding protein